MSESGPKKQEHIISILQLPFMATIVVPTIIWFSTRGSAELFQLPAYQLMSRLSGAVILVAGLLLFYKSVVLFDKIGRGTLAPWNPTKNIVVSGLYRHVRNPMLIGVNLILLAEGLLLLSKPILIWNLVFLLINHFYFILKEEPGLRKQFGQEYEEYSAAVPRWLPRIKGWYPENEVSN